MHLAVDNAVIETPPITTHTFLHSMMRNPSPATMLQLHHCQGRSYRNQTTTQFSRHPARDSTRTRIHACTDRPMMVQHRKMRASLNFVAMSITLVQYSSGRLLISSDAHRNSTLSMFMPAAFQTSIMYSPTTRIFFKSCVFPSYFHFSCCCRFYAWRVRCLCLTCVCLYDGFLTDRLTFASWAWISAR